MKNNQYIRRGKYNKRHRSRSTVWLAALLVAAGWGANADETQTTSAQPAQPPPAAKPAEKGAPLPLHQIEGNGGIFATLSAYIVNPPRNGEPIGRPSIGFAYVNIGHEQNLEAFTVTESPFKRLELGYGWDRLGLGDLPQALGGIPTDEVQLHNFNARFQILKEGEFDQQWIPALTAGVHYKYNDGFDQLNHDVGGALSSHGIRDNNGVDYTLYASKLFTQLPRPVLLEAGGRATKGVWEGLGGFSDNYSYLFEGNVVVFVTGNFALAAEYKQQPNNYRPIGSLVRKEGDWWTIDAAYVVNKHLTLAAGYGHFGNVLNHDANGVWGITTKWEF